MKKYLLFLPLLVLTASCKKSSLELQNPNAPVPETSLKTEAGLQAFALGLMQRMVTNVPDEGQANIMHIAFSIHSALGDEVFQPYGNFSIRWVNQPLSITLPSGQVVI
ncbi:MAG TPA: hypothetical protein VFL47_10040, partial [Flavisolibacter sp.]|nr:hypothetical protein [Flavisolibacter sp.]